jgi:hypothetical protein
VAAVRKGSDRRLSGATFARPPTKVQPTTWPSPLFPVDETSYAHRMDRGLFQRLHNPRNATCGCDPDCWCNRLAVGRAVKWWFPARWFGIEHKDSRRGTTFVGWSEKDIKAWKRAQQREARRRMESSVAVRLAAVVRVEQSSV